MCKKKNPTRHKLFQSSAVERRGCGMGGVRRRKKKNDNRGKKKRRLPFSTPCLVFSFSSSLLHVWQLVRSFKDGDSFRGDCSKCCRWLGGRRGEISCIWDREGANGRLETRSQHSRRDPLQCELYSREKMEVVL